MSREGQKKTMSLHATTRANKFLCAPATVKRDFGYILSNASRETPVWLKRPSMVLLNRSSVISPLGNQSRYVSRTTPPSSNVFSPMSICSTCNEPFRQKLSTLELKTNPSTDGRNRKSSEASMRSSTVCLRRPSTDCKTRLSNKAWPVETAASCEKSFTAAPYTVPPSTIARCMRSLARGQAARAAAAVAPEPDPMTVTVPGSPPNAAMFFCTQRSATTRS
mmetsp:Transcript_22137/g.58662  ORF Transcript_22137/g.58662 Transcript_22137/m.58662 type:complete len:221 (-) Transcript_22137:2536-3198(-)